MICSCWEGRLYERLPVGREIMEKSASATETRRGVADKIRLNTNTKVFVLRIGIGVSVDALLLTLGRLLRTLAGRKGSIYMMLAGRDAVGLAACRIQVCFRFNLRSRVRFFQFALTNAGAIQPPWHQTFLCPELPGRAGIATKTSASPEHQSVSSQRKRPFTTN